MFNFIKIQYDLGKIDEAKLDLFVSRGYITESQQSEIMSA